MNRTGKNYKFSLFGLLAVIALVAVAAIYGDGKGWFDDLKPASAAGGSGSNSDNTQQFAQIQPSVKATAKDTYNGTLLAGTTTVFIDGAKTSGTLGTAFNIGQGKTYEVIFDDGQHYTSRKTGSAPANGEDLTEIAMYPNGTLSSTFYNSAGTAATAQALGAADEKQVKVLLTSVNDKVFSNPDATENPIVCFDYNTTEMDSIELVGGSPAPIPQQAVGTYEECDYAPFKSLSDGSEYTLQVLLDADDSVGPACATDPVAIVYDQDLKIKTKAPIDSRVYGVESDSGSDIGGVNPTVTLDCS